MDEQYAWLNWINLIWDDDMYPQQNNPDSKVNGANIGPTWGRQDPGGTYVGPTNFAIWESSAKLCSYLKKYIA